MLVRGGGDLESACYRSKTQSVILYVIILLLARFKFLFFQVPGEISENKNKVKINFRVFTTTSTFQLFFIKRANDTLIKESFALVALPIILGMCMSDGDELHRP